MSSYNDDYEEYKHRHEIESSQLYAADGEQDVEDDEDGGYGEEDDQNACANHNQNHNQDVPLAMSQPTVVFKAMDKQKLHNWIQRLINCSILLLNDSYNHQPHGEQFNVDLIRRFGQTINEEFLYQEHLSLDVLLRKPTFFKRLAAHKLLPPPLTVSEKQRRKQNILVWLGDYELTPQEITATKYMTHVPDSAHEFMIILAHAFQTQKYAKWMEFTQQEPKQYSEHCQQFTTTFESILQDISSNPNTERILLGFLWTIIHMYTLFLLIDCEPMRVIQQSSQQQLIVKTFFEQTWNDHLLVLSKWLSQFREHSCFHTLHWPPEQQIMDFQALSLFDPVLLTPLLMPQIVMSADILRLIKHAQPHCYFDYEMEDNNNSHRKSYSGAAARTFNPSLLFDDKDDLLLNVDENDESSAAVVGDETYFANMAANVNTHPHFTKTKSTATTTTLHHNNNNNNNNNNNYSMRKYLTSKTGTSAITTSTSSTSSTASSSSSSSSSTHNSTPSTQANSATYTFRGTRINFKIGQNPTATNSTRSNIKY